MTQAAEDVAGIFDRPGLRRLVELAARVSMEAGRSVRRGRESMRLDTGQQGAERAADWPRAAN